MKLHRGGNTGGEPPFPPRKNFCSSFKAHQCLAKPVVKIRHLLGGVLRPWDAPVHQGPSVVFSWGVSSGSVGASMLRGHIFESWVSRARCVASK